MLCLEDDKRLSFDKNNNLKGMFVKTANCVLWDNEKHAVYIDEKGEGYFGVPENIYFIGTMNDIDKSVDSFDMALRRRFMWKHYRCNLEVVGEKYKDDKSVDEYLKICKNLNEYIIKDLGFCDEYELGQSYFMKPTKLTQKELDKVWIEHIEPLLREYLRVLYSKNEINAKIDNAKKIFNLPTK